MKKLLLFAFFVLQFSAYSQHKVATVLDAISGKAIPYANIKIGNDFSTISNSDGKFNIPAIPQNNLDKVEISFIGYESQQLTFSQLEKLSFIIKLVPGIYELINVDISDKKQDVASIMTKVKANLDENYKTSVHTTSQNRIFLRQQNTFIPKQLNVKIEKSTGFSKSKLKEVNTEIKSFVSNITKTPPKEFKDFLGDYASSWDKKENSWNKTTKLNVVKATKIKDENKSVSIDDLEKTSSNLFLKHLDTTKFYRVKSGWIGSRDTISFSKEFKKKQAKNKSRKNDRDRSESENEPKDLQEAKVSINNVLSSGNTLSGRNTSYLRYLDWYEYTLEGATFTEDYKLVYVIKFKPKKGKAKYEGTLYVSETDYAVVKATYNLAKGKTLGGINLKWILGVKSFENVSNGTLIFKENQSEKKYFLQYATIEDGEYFYVNRPLKFIELADNNRDVLALDLKVEGTILNKTEYLNLEQKEISENDFDQLQEPDFKFIKIKKYDPKIWKEFTTLEPAEEMKQFWISPD
jgi:hypothetical protein